MSEGDRLVGRGGVAAGLTLTAVAVAGGLSPLTGRRLAIGSSGHIFHAGSMSMTSMSMTWPTTSGGGDHGY